MIDQDLRPWLMEINLSPSLSLESNMDVKLKTRLVTDMFNMYGFKKLSTATLEEGTPWDEEKETSSIIKSQPPKHKCKNFKFENHL